ncbi:MAG TPA: hypothetical protein VKR31_01010 [Rhizomicrobium sp.]|nr:hypothetical protein [Rhizomicrobium sp.]
MSRQTGKIGAMGGFRRFLAGTIRASFFRFAAFVVLAVLGITQDKILAFIHGGQPEWDKVWQTHLAIQVAFIGAAFLVMAYAFYAYVSHLLNPPNEPDMTISDAINYLANDSMVQLRQSVPEIAKFGPAKGQTVRQGGVPHVHARDILSEKIITGELSVWGRRELTKGMAFKTFESYRRPIDKGLWNHATLEWHSVFYNAKDVSQTHMQEGHTDYCYAELVVNREQLERLWPPLPIWKRFWRTEPRSDYWGRPLDKNYRLVTPPSEFEAPYPYDSGPPPTLSGTDTTEWFAPSDAIDKFVDKDLTNGRDTAIKWLIEAPETKRLAEKQLREFEASAGPDTPDTPEIAATRRRLQVSQMQLRIGDDDLRFYWREIRRDLQERLAKGELIAKGFKSPHVADASEIIIPAAEWRFLQVNPKDATATGAGVEYVGIAIAKVP